MGEWVAWEIWHLHPYSTCPLSSYPPQGSKAEGCCERDPGYCTYRHLPRAAWDSLVPFQREKGAALHSCLLCWVLPKSFSQNLSLYLHSNPEKERCVYSAQEHWPLRSRYRWPFCLTNRCPVHSGVHEKGLSATKDGQVCSLPRSAPVYVVVLVY